MGDVKSPPEHVRATRPAREWSKPYQAGQTFAEPRRAGLMNFGFSGIMLNPAIKMTPYFSTQRQEKIISLSIKHLHGREQKDGK